jgi:hypothetical protein
MYDYSDDYQPSMKCIDIASKTLPQYKIKKHTSTVGIGTIVFTEIISEQKYPELKLIKYTDLVLYTHWKIKSQRFWDLLQGQGLFNHNTKRRNYG